MVRVKFLSSFERSLEKKKKAAREGKINTENSHIRYWHWKQILGTIAFGVSGR